MNKRLLLCKINVQDIIACFNDHYSEEKKKETNNYIYTKAQL